ncbi:MAG: hypothetical protein AB7T49_10085 [Oligoflexales bacterium]
MITLNSKLSFVLVSSVLVVCCSKGEFSAGSKSKSPSPPAADSETADAPADVETAGEPVEENTSDTAVSADDALSQCALALGGETADVIKITGGATDVAFTPDTIVYLETRGNANVVLPATEVASIKGICIDAGGGSGVDIQTSLNVAGMYVFGQGNPDLVLDFGDTGVLSKVLTDLGGNPDLAVSGKLIDCAKLEYQKQGAAELMCNGVPL